MHRITMWITIAVSALGLVVCYLAYATDSSQNPAVPTETVHGVTGISHDRLGWDVTSTVD